MSAELQFLPEHVVWLPVAIFLARIADVSIGTVRLICVTRGRWNLAVVLGFFEVVIWLFAVSSVFAHLNRWETILAYALGFTAGNAVGMWIEKSLAIGVQVVRLISRVDATLMVEALRQSGMTATILSGSDTDGPVSVCLAVIPRRKSPLMMRIARQVDPAVLVTVEDVAESNLGQVGMKQAGRVLSLPWLNRMRSYKSRQLVTRDNYAA